MSEPEQSRWQILIVDDLEENTRLLERFLGSEAFDVHSVYSGADALEFVRHNSPDTILLDLVMPGMDGFEVCTRLKNDPNTRHIPVIIITGLTERDANIQAIEAGADDFVTKPFDTALLQARIQTSLRTKKLQDKIISYQRQLETQNETLETRVGERTQQLQRMQHVTVFSLAKLAESRDTETGWHLERMRLYAREVALQLHLEGAYDNAVSDEFIDSLYHSSPVHDIGKVGIPDAILLKPGKLTPEEFDIMKRHATIGGATLSAANAEAGGDTFLAMGRDVAYYHHERWDGTGYPKGLKGKEIPLAARIVAIGDVYDALTSKRPYKEPFSHEKSKAIIEEGSGTQFDPVVIDAFRTREADFIRIREEFSDEQEAPIQMLMGQLSKVANHSA